MGGLDIIPRPRGVTVGREQFTLDETVRLVSDGSDAARAGVARVAELVAQETGLELPIVSNSRGATIAVMCDEEVSEEDVTGAYRLSAARSGIELAAPTRTGLHYAAQTLVGAVERRDGGWSVPTFETRDFPRHEWRGILLDPARGHIPLDRLKSLVDRSARAKLNRFHLHLIDTETYALESSTFPELSTGRTYSPDDVEELVEYAAERDVTVVPELEMPGHARHLIDSVPGLQCDVADPSDYTVCAGSERTYEVLEELIKEVSLAFPGEYFHVGGDEWALNVSWDDCPACQERIDAAGLDGLGGLFQYFLRRIYGFLTERDRQMVVWNDLIDVSTSPKLPRDIIICFWEVADPGRDWDVPVPSEGCSMQRFLEAGFDVVNACKRALYVNTSIERALVRRWTPSRFPKTTGDTPGELLGAHVAAWNGWKDEEWAALQRRSLPSAIPTFGDRIWNDTVPDQESLGVSVTRHVLGPYVPDGFDVYRELGSVLFPPDVDERADVSESLSGRAAADAVHDLQSTIGILESLLEAGRVRDEAAARSYVASLEWLVAVATGDGGGSYDHPR